jgi:hypothetical protein
MGRKRAGSGEERGKRGEVGWAGDGEGLGRFVVFFFFFFFSNLFKQLFKHF